MTTIPIKIILHGLLVLVPTQGTNDHITALLANSSTAHSHDGMCDMDHHPRFSFRVKNAADCRAAGCTSNGKSCVCEDSQILGKTVSFDISPIPTLAQSHLSNSPPGHVLPSNAAEAGSFSYIANLSGPPFGLRLDPSYLSGNPPTTLAVRVNLPFKEITSCSLAKRDDAGNRNIHSMSFRKLNELSSQGDIRQAVAQKVIAEVPVDTAATVTMNVSKFDGTEFHALILEPGGGQYRIEISNDPPVPLPPDDPCNDGIARHFGVFYKFSTTPDVEPLLPHTRPTEFVSPDLFPDELEPEICQEPTFAPLDRPICPIGTFNP